MQLPQLICPFVFAFAFCWFSYAAAHIESARDLKSMPSSITAQILALIMWCRDPGEIRQRTYYLGCRTQNYNPPVKLRKTLDIKDDKFQHVEPTEIKYILHICKE